MGEGMVTGICMNLKKCTVVVVKNIDQTKPMFFGFPGGIIEPGEKPESAIAREWAEEVGGENDFGPLEFMMGPPYERLRTSRSGDYFQYIFIINDPGKPLRKTGVTGEVEPPSRIPLKDITTGKVRLFKSHLATLRLVLEKLAQESLIMEDRLSELETFLFMRN